TLVVTLWVTAAAQGQRLEWHALPEMPMGVVAPAASVAGDRLVVTGGITLGAGTSDLVQVMDLRTQRWVTTYRLAHPRWGHAQVTLDDGRVLVVGGRVHHPTDRMSNERSCELIDLAHGEAPAADLPRALSTPTLHKLDDGRVVAAGGRIVTIYDPQTDAWSEPIALHQYRKEHDALLLDARTLLVAAGTGMQTFERVDLVAGESQYVLDPRLPINVDD